MCNATRRIGLYTACFFFIKVLLQPTTNKTYNKREQRGNPGCLQQKLSRDYRTTEAGILCGTTPGTHQGTEVSIFDPGYLGSVLVSSESDTHSSCEPVSLGIPNTLSHAMAHVLLLSF